jgi:hypothetical protein
VKIIDNCLPAHLFEPLSNSLLHTDMPWYYCSTAYDEEVSIFGYSYHHTILNDEAPNSTLCSVVEPVITNLIYKNGDQLDKIMRIRVGMITVTHERIVHRPHVDFAVPHKTGLLYINDADGDTTFYKNKYDSDSGACPLKFMESLGDLEIEAQVSPKANRLVLFDGLQYHSSSTPTKVARRIAINFNYTTK